jgi:uncharacterized membrane protein YdjX (TVP38/TMEM64 family)
MARARWFLLLLGLAAVGTVALVSADVRAALHAPLAAGRAWAQAMPMLAALVFALVEGVILAASIPAKVPLSVLAGVWFGVALGTLVSLAGSLLGAAGALCISRYLLRDWVRARMPDRWIATIDAGIAAHGGWYVFLLRLTPLVPDSIINPIVGLTQMRLRTFLLVSSVGMIPLTFLYVQAGALAGDLQQASDVLTGPVLAGLSAAAIVPLLLRWLTWRWWRVSR